MELSHMCWHALCFHNSLLLTKVWYEQYWCPLAILFWYLSLSLSPSLSTVSLPIHLSTLFSSLPFLPSILYMSMHPSLVPPSLSPSVLFCLCSSYFTVIDGFYNCCSIKLSRFRPSLHFCSYNFSFISSFRTIQWGFGRQHSSLSTWRTNQAKIFHCVQHWWRWLFGKWVSQIKVIFLQSKPWRGTPRYKPYGYGQAL